MLFIQPVCLHGTVWSIAVYAQAKCNFPSFPRCWHWAKGAHDNNHLGSCQDSSSSIAPGTNWSHSVLMSMKSRGSMRPSMDGGSPRILTFAALGKPWFKGRWKVERCGKMWKDYTTETLARCSRTVWAKSSKLPVDHSHADIATHTELIAAALTPNAATTKKTIAAVWGFFQYVLDIDILLGSTEHVLVGRGWENFNATISCLHPFSLKNPEDMRRYIILHYSVILVIYVIFIIFSSSSEPRPRHFRIGHLPRLWDYCTTLESQSEVQLSKDCTGPVQRGCLQDPSLGTIWHNHIMLQSSLCPSKPCVLPSTNNTVKQQHRPKG